MKLLPAQTRPATIPIERSHEPPSGPYRTYRACLRWEFGFTCAFCLVHEADLTEHGVVGAGLVWIEHHVAQSEDPSQRDVYDNCFYACRFCNQARSNRPRVDRQGRRLLHPCRDAWGTHFVLEDTSVRPRTGDADAAYTHTCYDLDEPRKREMRRARRDRLADALRALREIPERVDLLLRLAEDAERHERLAILATVRLLRRALDDGARQIERFRAVPRDAEPCRCAASTQTLPRFLDEQTREVPVA